MGLIKNLGSFAGKVAGGVVGGAVGLVGEATNSNFIKDVGRGVYKVSSRSGELLGNLAEGTVDTVKGIISEDECLASKGKNQLVNTASDTIKGVTSGVTSIAKKGIDTTGAILGGDKEKAVECGKDLLKIAAISALSIGVLDIIDGVDVIDDDVAIENPNMHSVEPHWRTLPDGNEIWVDGDGNTSINTEYGWTQHNPDYRSTI